MPVASPVDGFRLAYGRQGSGEAVVLLHDWPGDRADWREVLARRGEEVDAVTPDLRGLGESDKHLEEPDRVYSLGAQVASVVGLIEELGLRRPVIGAYDVGSRVAQGIARERPDLVGALVLAPPLPAVGERVLGERPQKEFWYQAFIALGCPSGGRDGRDQPRRAGAGSGGPDLGPDHGPVARARSSVSAGVGRPDRGVLSPGHRAGAPGRGALLPAGGR